MTDVLFYLHVDELSQTLNPTLSDNEDFVTITWTASSNNVEEYMLTVNGRDVYKLNTTMNFIALHNCTLCGEFSGSVKAINLCGILSEEYFTSTASCDNINCTLYFETTTVNNTVTIPRSKWCKIYEILD